MDCIEGYVTKVMDGDTFLMTVKWVGANNRRRYKDVEKIRLAGVDAPAANTPGGRSATTRLRGRLYQKYVHCDIRARDTYGRLVCAVRVRPPRKG